MDDKRPRQKRFCGPLTLVTDRPRVRRWIVRLSIVLPLLYVASFGPACWLLGKVPAIYPILQFAYRPLGALASCETACIGTDFFGTSLSRYGKLLLTKSNIVMGSWSLGEYQSGPFVFDARFRSNAFEFGSRDWEEELKNQNISKAR